MEARGIEPRSERLAQAETTSVSCVLISPAARPQASWPPTSSFLLLRFLRTYKLEKAVTFITLQAGQSAYPEERSGVKPLMPKVVYWLLLFCAFLQVHTTGLASTSIGAPVDTFRPHGW